MPTASYRTLHSLEQDGITPQLFSVLAKERKGNDMTSAPISIPPTLVFERGFVKFMFHTELSRVDGDRTVPVESDNLPKKFLNMHTAIEHGYRLEVKKKLGRDVIIKEVYEEFIADTKESDIVACLMMCQFKDRDDYSSFKYLDRSALYKFLMQTVDRPRAMLQKFVQPKGSNNTMIFAIWSPLVLVAEGRRSVHALTETSLPVDDRGVTFETDDVRLIRDLALPKSVIDEITTTCLAIKSHVESAERGLTLTRLACYFKIDQYSTLHLIAATSIRLQKTQKTEFRHPLDLNCGAASPLLNREAEAARMEQDLEDCEKKQHKLRMQLSSGIPAGSGMSIIAEARMKPSSSSASPNRHNQSHNTNNNSLAGSSPSIRSHQRLVKSGAVLPGGEVFPSLNAEEVLGARHQANTNGINSIYNRSSTPVQMRGVYHHQNNNNNNHNNISTISSPSWQRHRKHIQNVSSTPQPSGISNNVDKTIQSLLSKHQQHNQKRDEKAVVSPTPTANGNSEKPPRPNSPVNAVSFSPEATSKTPTPLAKRSNSAGLRNNNIDNDNNNEDLASRKANARGNFFAGMKKQQVNVGSSIESGIVWDALSSLPKSSNAQPFSTVFSRRIVQEGRVSNSWNAFLHRQKKELSAILQNSPVYNQGGGIIKNRGEFNAATSYDTTGGQYHPLANNNAYAPFASTSSNPYVQQNSKLQQQQQQVEPYPVGDMSIDFDNVTKRSIRQKQNNFGSGVRGTNNSNSPTSQMLEGNNNNLNNQDYHHHHHHHGAGAGGSSSMAGNLVKSLRQTQNAYMQPGGLANFYSTYQNQQQHYPGQRRQSQIGSGNRNGRSHSLSPGGETNSPQNQNDRKNALALATDKPIEQEEIPQLIDPHMLPKLKQKEGNQADSSIAFPNSVPKQVSSSTAIPAVFGAPRVVADGNGNSLAAAQAKGRSPDRPPSSPTASSRKNLTRYQQEQQRKAESEYLEQQKQQQMLLDGVVVHEATPKFWHLRSAHPEVTAEEFKRLKSHSPPLQDKAVELMFEFIRHVIHSVRRECRKMMMDVHERKSSPSDEGDDEHEGDKKHEHGGQNHFRPVYLELPLEMVRTSVTLDDVAAMFQPLHCRVVSRSEGLKMLEQASSTNSNSNSKKLSLSNTSWKEMSEKRSNALSRIDSTNYQRWYDFPGQSPAAEGFYTTAGTALIILPPSAEETRQLSAAILQNNNNNKNNNGNTANNLLLFMDTLVEDDQKADLACGLDYLLNVENGAVAYVCLKNLSMAKPDGRGGVVNNLPF